MTFESNMGESSIAKATARFLPALLILLAGCSTVHTQSPEGEALSMTREEFGRYVEQVFRHHNQVVNSLMEFSDEDESDDPDEVRELAAAKARMYDLCRPLNETIEESLVGREIGLRTQMALMDAVPACERATRAVEELAE
jgi:hypothetical protein